jgi:hypothetical protein
MSIPKRPVPNVPVLALVFNVLGGLILLGAVAVGVGIAVQFKSSAGIGSLALPLCGSLLFVGGFYLGAAEVIHLIARIAIEANRSAEAAERSAAAAESLRKQRLFLYHVGNDVRGPVSLEVLRSMRAVKGDMRQISGESLVCRVGDAEWKRLADFMDKSA